MTALVDFRKISRNQKYFHGRSLKNIFLISQENPTVSTDLIVSTPK
jgi:hypothetical protein